MTTEYMQQKWFSVILFILNTSLHFDGLTSPKVNQGEYTNWTATIKW